MKVAVDRSTARRVHRTHRRFDGFLRSDFDRALLTRQVRLQGLTVGNRQQQIEMIRALDAKDMKPVIEKTFPLLPLLDLIKAVHYEASDAHFGKICIDV